jgi:DedD protein
MSNHAMSDEEAQLKRRARRRLIGAVTLVMVMVVALPMLLDGEPGQSGQDIAINIPAPGSSGNFSSKAAPIPMQPGPVPASPPPNAEKVMAPTETQALPVAPPVPPAKGEELAKAPAAASAELAPTAKEPASQPKHEDEKSAEAISKKRQESVPFVIQLGAFANMTNAKERQSKLAALKVKFYTETVKAPSGDKLRVRAGPYATRQEAERVQETLKAAGIQDGVVAEKK